MKTNYLLLLATSLLITVPVYSQERSTFAVDEDQAVDQSAADQRLRDHSFIEQPASDEGQRVHLRSEQTARQRDQFAARREPRTSDYYREDSGPEVSGRGVERGRRSTRVSGDLAERVRQEIARNGTPDIQNFNVRVDGNTVVLEGTANDFREIDQVLATTLMVEGVNDIRSDIVLRNPPPLYSTGEYAEAYNTDEVRRRG